MRKITTLVLMMALLSQTCLAQHRNPLLLNREQQSLGPASEYVFRNDPEEVLIPVYVLGAVSKPGLYHIPMHTELVHLLALSGGPLKEAKLDEVMIRRPANNQVSEVNVLKLVSSKEMKSPTLAANDVIMIDTKEPAISSNTIITVGLISSIVGLIVSGFVVKAALSK